MIHFINSKGERLPEDINKVANERYDPRYSMYGPDNNNELWVCDGFDWHKTFEGRYIWNQVDDGNYQSFYKYLKTNNPAKQARKAEIIAEIEKLQNKLKEIEIDILPNGTLRFIRYDADSNKHMLEILQALSSEDMSEVKIFLDGSDKIKNILGGEILCG
jgi:hypothetical protein